MGEGCSSSDGLGRSGTAWGGVVWPWGLWVPLSAGCKGMCASQVTLHHLGQQHPAGASGTQLCTVTPGLAHGMLPIPPTATPRWHHSRTADPIPMAHTDFPHPMSPRTLPAPTAPWGAPAAPGGCHPRPADTPRCGLRFRGTPGPSPAQPLATGVTPPPVPPPIQPRGGRAPRGRAGRADAAGARCGAVRCGPARLGPARLLLLLLLLPAPGGAARRGRYGAGGERPGGGGALSIGAGRGAPEDGQRAAEGAAQPAAGQDARSNRYRGMGRGPRERCPPERGGTEAGRGRLVLRRGRLVPVGRLEDAGEVTSS